MTEQKMTYEEAMRERQRRECATHGHSWEIISTFAAPVRIVCACGSYRIADEETA